MQKSVLARFAPALWIIAGVLFLLPGMFGSSNNPTSIGIGIMFIIIGVVTYWKGKSDTTSARKP